MCAEKLGEIRGRLLRLKEELTHRIDQIDRTLDVGVKDAIAELDRKSVV